MPNIKESFGKVGVGTELLRNNQGAEKDIFLFTVPHYHGLK